MKNPPPPTRQIPTIQYWNFSIVYCSPLRHCSLIDKYNGKDDNPSLNSKGRLYIHEEDLIMRAGDCLVVVAQCYVTEVDSALSLCLHTDIWLYMPVNNYRLLSYYFSFINFNQFSAVQGKPYARSGRCKSPCSGPSWPADSPVSQRKSWEWCWGTLIGWLLHNSWNILISDFICKNTREMPIKIMPT